MNKAGLAVPEGKEPAGGNSGIRNIINDLGEQMRQNKSRPAFTQERVAKMVDEFKSAIFKT
jgi:hypothetical protein